MNESALTHVVGTFLIQAEGAFLNGAGLAAGEDRNLTVPKTFTDFRDRVPYVSAQAWKRWLRETFQEENPDESPAELKQLMTGTRGQTAKIGTEMDPVTYAEDDIFGYMRAERGQGRRTADDEEAAGGQEAEIAPTAGPEERVAAVMRTAPFAASILSSLRKSGWEGLDEGFVHLKEGTPLPYSTRFYNTQLQGIFGLNYERLGTFRNEGDRIELDRPLVEKYLKEGTIQKDPQRAIYRMTNNPCKDRATKILKALAVLRGGAKQAAFATDVAPKVIILAGLSCGNLIFNDLFEDMRDGPKLKLNTLKEVIADYADRIMTPVFIGVRTGYLHADSERELCEWAQELKKKMEQGEKVTKMVLTTPVQAIAQLTEQLR
jgi:CRISPR-associated protein Cst2